jgi:hypothetical protein
LHKEREMYGMVTFLVQKEEEWWLGLQKKKMEQSE